MKHFCDYLSAPSIAGAVVLIGLWLPGSNAQTITGSGTSGHVAQFTGTTTIGNTNIIDSSGNIGIGTTTPAAKLEVNGTMQVDSNLAVDGSIFGGSDLLIQYDLLTNEFSAGPLALGSGSDTGQDNTALGYKALYANTSGEYNTAAGSGAMGASTTGEYNVAVGAATMYDSTTGGGNVAVGFGAMYDNTSGSGNTAVGNTALQAVTTGSYNIAIGSGAGELVGTGSNNVDIANFGLSTDSGVTRIGSAGSQTSTYISGIYGVTTGTSGAVQVLIDSNGNLGTISSSRRYKEDIQDMGDSSSGLMQLRPVTFRYKKAFSDGSKPIQYGLIAEEVAEVYPDLVTRTADGQVESVKYQVLDSMLLSELQKQNAALRAQRETIAAQRAQISSLEQRLARVEAAVEHTSLVASTH